MMKVCLSAMAAAIALAGCVSAPDESKVGTLGFYEWFEKRRAEYAAALDKGDEMRAFQDSVLHVMAREIQRRYEAVVQRAATEEDPEGRELAVSALGFSARPEAVIHLEERLADPIAQVRGTAAAAIGFLNPPSPPIEKITPLLDDSDPYVRQGALFAIKRLVRPGSAFPKPALERISKLAQEEAKIDVRNEAVIALGRIQDAETIDLLSRACLVDEAAIVRWNAAYSLGLFGTRAQQAVPHLINRLRDGESGVVEVAHWALKRITNRVDADRSYSSWYDWLTEISKVLEYYCSRDETVSASPGPCPKCGIVMEPRAIREAEFACPEHPEVVSLKPGTCRICQKELHPRKKDAPR
jgi:hypothetical protein